MPTIDQYNDFATDHLTGEALAVASAIREFMRGEDALYNGGCKAFYSAEEWKARREEYGTDSVLILCHDGGELSYRCNSYKGQISEVRRFNEFIASLGYMIEGCTCWYSAVYRRSPAPETWFSA